MHNIAFAECCIILTVWAATCHYRRKELNSLELLFIAAIGRRTGRRANQERYITRPPVAARSKKQQAGQQQQQQAGPPSLRLTSNICFACFVILNFVIVSSSKRASCLIYFHNELC